MSVSKVQNRRKTCKHSDRYSETYKIKLKKVESACKRFEAVSEIGGKGSVRVGIVVVDRNGRVTLTGNPVVVQAIRESNCPNILTEDIRSGRIVELENPRVPVFPLIDKFEKCTRDELLAELSDMLEQILGPGHSYSSLKKNPPKWWPEGFAVVKPKHLADVTSNKKGLKFKSVSEGLRHMIKEIYENFKQTPYTADDSEDGNAPIATNVPPSPTAFTLSPPPATAPAASSHSSAASSPTSLAGSPLSSPPTSRAGSPLSSPPTSPVSRPAENSAVPSMAPTDISSIADEQSQNVSTPAGSSVVNVLLTLNRSPARARRAPVCEDSPAFSSDEETLTKSPTTMNKSAQAQPTQSKEAMEMGHDSRTPTKTVRTPKAVKREKATVVAANINKRTSGRIRKPTRKRQNNPDEPTYCLCEKVSYGEMVGCDNSECPIEWFHFGCVGLETKPKGKWYCARCLEERKKKT